MSTQETSAQNPRSCRERWHGTCRLPVACVLFAASLAGLAACQADEPTPKHDKDTPAQDEISHKDQSHMKHAANHLSGETSPYLLMHVHNPVDWYPWGEEALAKAQKENRPIFLSIGYSSCYWCHVMERESFTDEQIAAFLNENFVCIKVDREERPDLDDIYMTSVQLMTQRGGWPMSVFLTPEGKPFYGGTYFPPRQSAKYPHPGFFELLQEVIRVWSTNRDGVQQSADRLTDAIRQQLQRPTDTTGAKIDKTLIDRTIAALGSRFDEKIGGFGWSDANPRMPKFPEPSKLEFLLQRASAGDERAHEMLVTSLDRMARGGIYDHLGNGFHRYSTDRFWWVPHFEKMLYDNGLLASVYAEAHALAAAQGNSDEFEFGDVARGICDFVLREMTSPDGGFYAAIDAETDAEEGKFYVWTDADLAAVLDANERELLGAIYVWKTGALVSALPLPPNQTDALRRAFGNADEPIFEGRNVLMLGKRLVDLAATQKMTVKQLQDALDPLKEKLLTARSRRERPLTDTKILTSWNGLMIRGMADTGRVLGDQRFIDAAARAADFILTKLRKPDGRLLRTFREDQAKLNAYVDDYAFLVSGLVALYRATNDAKWLEAARELTDRQIELFWDDERGGFFFTSHDHEALIARGKDPSDGAIPSGNSVSATNLLALAEALDEPKYRGLAKRTMEAVLPWAEGSPDGTCGTAKAAAILLEPAGS